MDACMLCPRQCGVNRVEQLGFCQMPRLPRLARASLHHWEEPCLSGSRGAGTVFFSGCTLRCIYCQNEQISAGNTGKNISQNRLREIFWELIAQGAHNIDLVNPSHFAHVLADVLSEPLPVPVVWNSSGYERRETVERLAGKVQIYLPDLKYLREETAVAYSQAPYYPAIAKEAIQEMVRQRGAYVLDEAGILQSGVLIRHLLLPNGLQEAKEVMDWVAESFPPNTVLFSLMGQYIPCGKAKTHPVLKRSLRKSEWNSANAYMDALGLLGYTQDLASADSQYIPLFDGNGVERAEIL